MVQLLRRKRNLQQLRLKQPEGKEKGRKREEKEKKSQKKKQTQESLNFWTGWDESICIKTVGEFIFFHPGGQREKENTHFHSMECSFAHSHKISSRFCRDAVQSLSQQSLSHPMCTTCSHTTTVQVSAYLLHLLPCTCQKEIRTPVNIFVIPCTCYLASEDSLNISISRCFVFQLQ